jgi:ketosteroid isomerase-like protein
MKSTTDVVATEVAELTRQWTESYARRDTSALERYLSDDYVSTFPDGKVLDKKGEIEAVASGAVAFTEIPGEMNVRVYGDAAVVTGWSFLKARVADKDVSGDYRFIHVWTKRSERWQVVASQVTRIAGDQS